MSPRRCHTMHKNSDRKQGLRGFTLLELLVVMSILTLIMTASFGAVRLGSRSFEAGIKRANETEQLRATADFLRRQFAQLAPIVQNIDVERVISFIGDQEQISFIAPAPQHTENAGLFVYRLTAAGDYDDKRLLLAYAPYDPGAEDFAEVIFERSIVLTDGQAEIRFEFYGVNYEREDPAWHEVWVGEPATFPKMVRIHLVTASGSANWPDLVFAIRAESPS